jgi:hypothetical protein
MSSMLWRAPGLVCIASTTLRSMIFDGYQALDLAGPYDVFAEAGYDCLIVAPRAGPVRSNTGMPVLATGVAERSGFHGTSLPPLRWRRPRRSPQFAPSGRFGSRPTCAGVLMA